MKHINIFVKKLFSQKRFVVALSLVIAFIFWMIITIDQNPTRQKTLSNITINVDVSASAAENLGLDIVNKDFSKYATVTVEGPNYIVSSLKSSDVSVVADLSDITEPGTKSVTLKAQREGSTSGYSFISVSPATIELTFDYFQTREFVVEPKADGIKAVSGLVVDTPIINSLPESKISIRGPKKEVDIIDKVVATVNKSEILDASKSYDANLVLYDVDGNVLDNKNFEFSATDLKVTVPICKQKVLTVVPTFINETNAGVGKSLVKSLSVNKVTVIGPAEAVDNLEFAELTAIDFTAVNPTNRIFEVSLALPDGVRSVDNISVVTVEFGIANYRTKNIKLGSYSITFKNLDPSLSASITSGEFLLTLCGQQKTLNSITNKNIQVEVDLTGKTAGTYTVTPIVKVNMNSPVWQVGSLTVTVEIK
jgi:YbbR domain-containing protein